VSLSIFSGVAGCPRVTRLLLRDARVVAASAPSPPTKQRNRNTEEWGTSYYRGSALAENQARSLRKSA